MAFVGLFLCGTGIVLGGYINNFEKSILFSAERGGLDLVNQLVSVVVCAAGGNIVASALSLRAQLASARERTDAERERRQASARIGELRRALKFLALDASFMSKESVDERQTVLFSVLEKEQKKYLKADKVLQELGYESAGEPLV
jgi:hypothetical protein